MKNSFQPVLIKTLWLVMTLGLSLVLVSSLYILKKLGRLFTFRPFATSTILNIGFVGVFGGYMLARSRSYELLLFSKQILGSLLNGLLLKAILFISLRSAIGVADSSVGRLIAKS